MQPQAFRVPSPSVSSTRSISITRITTTLVILKMSWVSTQVYPGQLQRQTIPAVLLMQTAGLSVLYSKDTCGLHMAQVTIHFLVIRIPITHFSFGMDQMRTVIIRTRTMITRQTILLLLEVSISMLLSENWYPLLCCGPTEVARVKRISASLVQLVPYIQTPLGSSFQRIAPAQDTWIHSLHKYVWGFDGVRT